jgi:hypothetical protein
VVQVGNSRNACKVWWVNLKERNHLEDVGVDMRIILKWVMKQAGMAWTESVWRSVEFLLVLQ